MKAIFLPITFFIAISSAGFSQTFTEGEWTYKVINADPSDFAQIVGYSGAGGGGDDPGELGRLSGKAFWLLQRGYSNISIWPHQ